MRWDHPSLSCIIMLPVEGGHSRAQSPTNLAASTLKIYQPYFVPTDLEHLTDRTRGRFSHGQEDKNRQNAVGFLETIGARIGLCVDLRQPGFRSSTSLCSLCSPRKTIATAQILYHRFHLFFPRKDFNYIVRPSAQDALRCMDCFLCVGCLPWGTFCVNKDAWHLEETPGTLGCVLCCPFSWLVREIQTPRWRNRSRLYGSPGW